MLQTYITAQPQETLQRSGRRHAAVRVAIGNLYPELIERRRYARQELLQIKIFQWMLPLALRGIQNKAEIGFPDSVGTRFA